MGVRLACFVQTGSGGRENFKIMLSPKVYSVLVKLPASIVLLKLVLISIGLIEPCLVIKAVLAKVIAKAPKILEFWKNFAFG